MKIYWKCENKVKMKLKTAFLSADVMSRRQNSQYKNVNNLKIKITIVLTDFDLAS